MISDEVRKKYLDFFTKRGHRVIPSASLVPDNDPTTLFVGSGMQPLLPFLLGQRHPEGDRLVDSQKCFRAEDIDEVGDNRHTTFFEMLGNWSLGSYWKEEQLHWLFEFLTQEVVIPAERLWTTCFEGDDTLGLPRDEESAKIWEDIGIPRERILFYGAEKNWWSRVGVPEKMPPGEPGGPDSEVFYDFDPNGVRGIHAASAWKRETCHPNCDCGRFMEIGNSVFMQYVKKPDGSFGDLPQKNVDFGGGLERITAAANDNPDVFKVDSLRVVIEALEHISGNSYDDQKYKKPFRIIADHMRAAIFMISDDVLPSNTEQGYFVRRLLRRSMVKFEKIGLTGVNDFTILAPVDMVLQSYSTAYPELGSKAKQIRQALQDEEKKFSATLKRGLKEFEKMGANDISGKEAFTLFSTYGFPLELTLEIAGERGVAVDTTGFQKEMQKHQEVSRKGAEQKFKGGLADASAETTRLHTATHLLLAGLRKYLGEDVHQAGSNITAERTRFDFTYPAKVERDVLDKVERYVNDAIEAAVERIIEEMPKEEAKAAGVEGSFWERYPDTVSVYVFKDQNGTIWSRELCGGPHVTNTREIGEGGKRFVITKEEAVAAGTRRAKASLR